MQPPANPLNEAERLSVLEALSVLDTLPEERFDRITRIAQRVMRTQIALVSLVDGDRQWFKSRQGLEATETPRDISFCGHTILGRDVFVVEDASEDPRFADNPLVTAEPNIRFYAGCPLTMRNGFNVGTLCVIDDQPNMLTADDAQLLKDLGALVVRELELSSEGLRDSVTGLYNEPAFVAEGTRRIAKAERNAQDVWLLNIDVDGFASFNWTHGRRAGDEVLGVMAYGLNEVADASQLVGRVGADEFAVLFTGVTRAEVDRFAEALRQKLQVAASADQRNAAPSFSHGAFQYEPESHQSFEALLEDADIETYRKRRRDARQRIRPMLQYFDRLEPLGTDGANEDGLQDEDAVEGTEESTAPADAAPPATGT